jgi:hypothetical protein
MAQINFFTDYHPRGTSFSDPGNGNPYIDFHLTIPVGEYNDLLQHVVTCGRTNRNLTGINYSQNQKGFVLPIIEGPEFKNHLINLSKKGFAEVIRNEFIEMKNRYIEFIYTPEKIVGIQTQYGKPYLTVEEVNAIYQCMKSYVLVDDRVKDYKHHIPIEQWKESAYDELIDPLTLELFIDPVIASDGHTYSKFINKNIFK